MANTTNKNQDTTQKVSTWKLTEKTTKDLTKIQNIAKTTVAEQLDSILNAIQGANMPYLAKAVKDIPGLDAVTLGIGVELLGKSDDIYGYREIANKYKEVSKKIDTTNGAVIWSALTTDPKIFLGDLTTEKYMQLMKMKYAHLSSLSAIADHADAAKAQPGKTDTTGTSKLIQEAHDNKAEHDKKTTAILNVSMLPRIDMPLFQQNNTTNSGPSNSGGKTPEEDQIELLWDERDYWYWAEFAPRFVQRAQMMEISLQTCAFYPKIIALYKAIEKYLVESRYDAQDYWFPFTDDQLREAKGGIFFSAPFGWNNTTQVDHRGIDFNAPKGTGIRAVHDGKITSADDGWGAGYGTICLMHGDGSYSRYMHCDTINVKKGQQIKKGDIIGTVGGKGPNGPDQFKPHLHLEISQGGSEESTSYLDPVDFYPKFAVQTGEQLLPAGEAELYQDMLEAQKMMEKAVTSNDGSVDKAMAAIKATN